MRRQNNTIDLQGLKKELLNSNKVNDKWESYSCTLVTPMYGGGVKAGEVDKDMPIRASAIRGQLRFWWRIACGPEDPKELFEKETEIWGGIGEKEAKASRVEIRVSNVKFKGEVPAFEYERNHKDPSKYKSVPKPDPKFGHAYVLFSAQGKLIDRGTKIGDEPIKIAKPDLCFDLEVRYKIYDKKPLSQEHICEVNEAIRWWASFGGIGSRTRRGLGAIQVIASKTAKKITPVKEFEVNAKGGKLVLVAEAQTDDAIKCWRLGCDKLRDFRQGKNIGRNPPKADSKSPAGQSFWPEADSIRNLSGYWSNAHKPKIQTTNLFPRSAFGLPIIFHFQQPKESSTSEPQDHTIGVSGKDNERLASPLILRPYLDESGKWLPAALLLPKWESALTQQLEIKNLNKLPKRKNNNYSQLPTYWPTDNNERKTLAKNIKPMVGKDGQLRANDPLSAFLDFFEKGQ
ncbi:type III-B CRISPR module RAMP protein Cmr1 [Vibrio cholerae]|uniref:type III-B CRISPR module RAMP protein Cmr1 n=1 Tax=Vibrio cholerae TaxID=666 RepID=UPI001DE489D9|nr:type III-B CRISPR module RAMP protein Cmr1 [Vibrio cholerae]MBO1401506.1 type III-B CRISPR module RAMP protein Cmr1 [Vibrio cholerae]